MVAVNAYILYKDLNPVKENRMSHYLFRETIVRELCDIQESIHQSAGAKKQANRQLVGGKKQAKPNQHSSVRMSKARDCIYCRLVYKKRRRTTRQCSKCDAALCLQARNAFKNFIYHSLMKREMIGYMTDQSPKFRLLVNLEEDQWEAQHQKDEGKGNEKIGDFRFDL